MAAFRRDDAGSNGSAQAKGIAHGDNPLSNFGFFFRKRDKRKLFIRAGLDEREVGLLVSPNNLCLKGFTFIGSDLNLLRIIDDVIVGHDIAVRRNEEARSLRFNPLGRDLAPLPAMLFLELAEEFFHRRALERTVIVIRRQLR